VAWPRPVQACRHRGMLAFTELERRTASAYGDA
jgi:hypothetical protein